MTFAGQPRLYPQADKQVSSVALETTAESLAAPGGVCKSAAAGRDLLPGGPRAAAVAFVRQRASLPTCLPPPSLGG